MYLNSRDHREAVKQVLLDYVEKNTSQHACLVCSVQFKDHRDGCPVKLISEVLDDLGVQHE